jgi:hypothetical protein
MGLWRDSLAEDELLLAKNDENDENSPIKYIQDKKGRKRIDKNALFKSEDSESSNVSNYKVESKV